MDQNSNNTEEEIVQRHRKEKKELQAKIQALKKTATKGDKKKKKEVSEEILKLETDQEKRHSDELSAFNAQNVNDVTATLDSISLEEAGKGSEEVKQCEGRVSKAQRRREKKAIELKERQQRISQQEADNKLGVRHLETKKIKQILKERNLKLNEIPSDGNCLYNAIDDQLKQCGTNMDGSSKSRGLAALRQLASGYLKQNMAGFLPFLSHQDTGDTFTEEQYAEYCDKVANTTAWAGQVELTALSKALNCRIDVIQAESPVLRVGESGPLLTITFHRHMYSLGAHYNSVRPHQYTDQEEEGEDEAFT